MSAANLLLKKYGVPDVNYQMKYCEVWYIQKDFPWFGKVKNDATDDSDDFVVKVLINKDFKAMLVKAFKELEEKGLHTEIETYNGCYNPRTVRGRNSTSIHAWAGAWDLNKKKEELAQKNTHWSKEFISVMKKHGIYWGGDFKSRLDSMHFAIVNG